MTKNNLKIVKTDDKKQKELKEKSKSLEAADAMKLTAKELLKLGIIDEVIEEPLGGAHRDYKEMAGKIKKSQSS